MAAARPGPLLEEFVEAHDEAITPSKIQRSEAGRAILEAPEDIRSSVLTLVLLELTWVKGWSMAERRVALAARLLKDRVPVSDESMIGVLSELLNAYSVTEYVPIVPLVDWFAARYEQGDVSAELDTAFASFRGDLGKLHFPLTKPFRESMQEMDILLGRVSKNDRFIPKAVDAWTAALFDFRDELAALDVEKLNAFLELADGTKGSKPTKTFVKRADALREEFPRFAPFLQALLESIGMPGPPPSEHKLLSMDHTDLLRGLVWMCAGEPSLALPLGGAAERCYKKVSGHGPLCAKVGTACVNALSRMGSVEAMGQLSRLQTVVKHASTRKQLEKALKHAAEAAGVTRTQLEEMSVPDGGLSEVGRLERTFNCNPGAFTAELTVESATASRLVWRKADGRLQKSVPAAVKADHPEALKDLKKTAKELKGLLLGQRHRLERMFLADRTISLADWRRFYMDHPLVGFFARRLIWRVGSTLVACPDPTTGELADVEDNVIEPSPNAEVRLWHPVDSEAAVVGAWRAWLFKHEITQPVKQAYREVYVITPAELDSGRYSNRFAAHILKQHQFHALCGVRGWRYGLMGNWDSDNTPTLHLPEHGFRVEFWVAGIDGETGETGVFLYIATDQVRFYREEPDEGEIRRQPQELNEIPPRLFTELMRDIDLFVGVCSVGNDPDWYDQGLAPYRDYWERSSFGELNASATSRREVLERLLPRLKIAKQCTLSKNFLVVKGSLRTYRIHLGSSNIQMEPNNQYLCIVKAPRSKKENNIFLPFEGDTILALILSKAFLLADDGAIKDGTILAQINHDA